MPAVSVQCPHCNKSYSVDDSLVGRRARRKHCGNSFSLTPSAEIAVAELGSISARSPDRARTLAHPRNQGGCPRRWPGLSPCPKKSAAS